jgi:CelD/BcsL family acetyltransferase involved in cellulose biosynthesis
LFLRDILIPDAARRHLSLTVLTQLLRASELRWDILCLWHVLDDSCTMAAYRLGAPRFTVCAARSQCCWIAAEPWDELTKKLSKNFRKSLRAARRRAEEMGALSYQAVTTMPQLERACDEFLQVESSGWKGAAGTGTAIAADPQLVRFYKELTRRFAEQGRCHIHVLRDGEKPIAAQFALLDETTVYTLKTGYDESYSKISPGHLLDQHTFSWYGNHSGLKEINLASDAPYLDAWKPQRMAVHNVYAFNRTPFGWAAAAAMKLAQIRKPAGV